MGFSPDNYSMMFDSINHMTDKKDIINRLCLTTSFSKRYIMKLCNLAKEYKGKTVWYLKDLEEFFGFSLHVCPFFRAEFFIGGWDYNSYIENDEFMDYATACGLKKMLLILSVGTSLKDIDNGKHAQITVHNQISG